MRENRKYRPRSTAKSKSVGSDPRYLEIANNLRQELLKGKFGTGQRFYSIRKLIQETGRSLPTVRSAVNILVDEGFLQARPGSGFYVTNKVEEIRSRGQLNILTVMPSYTAPTEPWFTGKIFTGMINVAEKNRAVVSFYQRKNSFRSDPENAKIDLERILSTRPSGIAWLHAIDSDVPLLKELIAHDIPVVATMRKLKELNLPLIQENNLVFASMVLSQFQARGHRSLAMILRNPQDDYFSDKISTLTQTAKSFGIRLEEKNFYVIKTEAGAIQKTIGKAGTKWSAYKIDAVDLERFLKQRKEITGIINLASEGLYPILLLMESPFKDYFKRTSLLHNILDGVAIPTLPTGESLATIAPPLEALGEQLVNYLCAVVQGKTPELHQSMIPVFSSGTSMKMAPSD